MSLINDALKRTRDTAYQAAATGPVDAEQYRIANQSGRHSVGSRLGLAVAVVMALAVGIGAIVVFSSHSVFPRRKDREQLPPDSTVHRATVSPSAPALPVPSSPGPPSIQVPAAATTIPPTAAEGALLEKMMQQMKTEQAAAQKAPEAPPPAPEPSEPPKLVLQGIMRQGGSREAMINGSNLREGDEIEGARLVAIEARAVRLRFADQEIVLRLP